MDIYININAKEFKMYKDYVQENPLPPPPPGEFGNGIYNPPALSEKVYQKWRNEVDCDVCGEKGSGKAGSNHNAGEKLFRNVVPWGSGSSTDNSGNNDDSGNSDSNSNPNTNTNANTNANPDVAAETTSKPLVIAVFGTHATLSLEPVHMLRNFVFQKRKLKPIFYGLEERWCKLMGMCDRGDPAFAKFFKDQEQDP